MESLFEDNIGLELLLASKHGLESVLEDSTRVESLAEETTRLESPPDGIPLDTEHLESYEKVDTGLESQLRRDKLRYHCFSRDLLHAVLPLWLRPSLLVLGVSGFRNTSVGSLVDGESFRITLGGIFDTLELLVVVDLSSFGWGSFLGIGSVSSLYKSDSGLISMPLQ